MTLDKQHSGSPIRLRLDPSSGVPTYLQLVQQVEGALRLGVLQPGDQLPKVREVVAELAINPNTVLKAYRELEHKGLASGRPGAGTFIEASLTPVSLPELAALRRSLRRWLDDAAAAGLDDDGVVTLVENTLRDFPERAAPRRDAQPRTRRGGGAA
jgi:GntR family transcriptional regulator